MMAAMKASLDYYTSTFGPYPYRELRVVEVPPYSINGRAFPAAMAGAIFQVNKYKGKFHGEIHPTMPSG